MFANEGVRKNTPLDPFKREGRGGKGNCSLVL